jgi:hypothetical protein
MRISLTIASLLIAGLLLAACGTVDDAKDKVVRSGRAEVAHQCLIRAKKIDNRGDRQSAIRACQAVRRGDSRSIRAEVGRRCMKRAVKISDPDLRRKARIRCHEILAGGK